MSKLPPELAPYAWNIPRPLTAWGKAAIALEVMLHATPRLRAKLPKGWFNFAFAKRHATVSQLRKLDKLKRTAWDKHRYPSHD